MIVISLVWQMTNAQIINWRDDKTWRDFQRKQTCYVSDFKYSKRLYVIISAPESNKRVVYPLGRYNTYLYTHICLCDMLTINIDAHKGHCYSPMQLNLSSPRFMPWGHSQRYEPAVFTHLCSQPPFPLSHSFISAIRRKKNMYLHRLIFWSEKS